MWYITKHCYHWMKSLEPSHYWLPELNKKKKKLPRFVMLSQHTNIHGGWDTSAKGENWAYIVSITHISAQFWPIMPYLQVLLPIPEQGSMACLQVHTVPTVALGPSHWRSIYHNSNSMKNQFGSHSISNTVILTKFCTWHGSCAVMWCAKFCSDLITRAPLY